MQHFYNTHIFKSSLESCREEGIVCEVGVEYVDNVPCIDLISSLVRGGGEEVIERGRWLRVCWLLSWDIRNMRIL